MHLRGPRPNSPFGPICTGLNEYQRWLRHFPAYAVGQTNGMTIPDWARARYARGLCRHGWRTREFAKSFAPCRPPNERRLELAPGVLYWPRYLDPAQQQSLSAEMSRLAESAPFYRPAMPRTGHKLSVEMTNFGGLGWFTDAEKGYRYEAHHPLRGTPWPHIPELLLDIWRATTGYPGPPEACLVNLYRGRARMGLHRDSDEEARDAPVLSVSLGDTAIFRFGLARKSSSTQTL